MFGLLVMGVVMNVKNHGAKDYSQTLCKESLSNVQFIKEIGAK